MMCTYVDDIMCFGPSAEVDAAISGVQSVWATSTPNRLAWGSGNTLKFCGMWITDCAGAGYRVHQTEFVRELLTAYGMSGARPSLTPGDREGGPPTSAQQAKSQKPSN